MAHAKHTDAAFSVTAISWSDTDENPSASGMAIRTGEPLVLRDIESESRFAPKRAAALQQGYRSMIALPIKANAHAIGNLSIFPTEYKAFDVGFKPWEVSNAPSGLGLSMISERAKGVGGQAEIHSTPGEGTTVSITVACRSDPASTEEPVTLLG